MEKKSHRRQAHATRGILTAQRRPRPRGLLSQPREELVPRVRVRARRVEALEQLRDVLREEATPNRHLKVVKRVLQDIITIKLVDHAQDRLEHLRAALGREDEFDTRHRLEAAQRETAGFEGDDARGPARRDGPGDFVQAVERRAYP